MELEHELGNYLRENLQESPLKCAEFLVNAWNSSSLAAVEKYEVILKIFMKDFLEQLLATNFDLIKEVLLLKFPQNSVSNEAIKSIMKKVKQLVENGKSIDSIEICTTILLNESYKKFFSNNLNSYCKLIGSVLTCFNEIKCDKFEILDDLIFELHYFAKSKDFPLQFRQFVLVPLYQTAKSEKYEKINDLWNLIKSIFFSRSLSLNKEEDSALNLFSDKEITFEQMEVLTESFIISFKSESVEIAKFLNHFNEEVLSKHQNENAFYLNYVKMLYALLKKHDIEVAALKKLESSFEDLSLNVLNRVENAINEMSLCEYFQVLSIIVSYDPFLFVENNFIYTLIVECMMKEKLDSDLPQYESLLCSVLKIFGKDINQFIKKLLLAIESKLENFVIPKKRKRKITNESDSSSKKKMKLADGSAASADTFNLSNIWPNSVKSIIDEIFAELNVNQTVRLWKLLNNSLRNLISNLEITIEENILFKIDFISSLICQLVTASRIHEHLVYKSSEITSAIGDFNSVQHNFYETIIKIEYNNRIMNAFLKMSYDYENFIMMYFYHYEEEDTSELDPIFIADKSRIKSGEWKIIQQRIKNFGKVEEKSYLNLLMIQHFIKGKLFKISNYEDQNDFLQNLILDKDQINLLLERKDVRIHIFNLLSDESTNLIEDLCLKIEDDQEKLINVLDLVKNNSKMLELFLAFLLKKCSKQNHEAIEILKKLPISFLSQENKKMIIQKMLFDMGSKYLNENSTDSIIIFNKIFKNDGYKTFLKDFTMNNLVDNLSNTNKYRQVYEMIIRTSIKKITTEVLTNFEWIINESRNNELEEILAKCLTETNATATSDCSMEKINIMKFSVIKKLSTKLNEKNIAKQQHAFCIFSKLCSQNMQILEDETKEHHLNLLNKLLKLMTKSSALDSTIELFMSTLKNAKKLNLNDEIKAGIVKALTKHLYSVVEDVILKEEKYENVDRERELIATLSSFKSNCREECSQYLHKLISGRETITDKQVIYSFMIYEILFESYEKTDKKESLTLIKNYMKHCDNFVTLRTKISEIDLLRAIYLSHIAMLKSCKEKLDFVIIDHIFTFHIDQRYRPQAEDVENFCKFYETVGEFLFVLGNFHQNYFKSRIPQYFKAYNKFLDAIYYYKAEEKDEFSAKESSMLLRLTLQLENIMKMLMKLHSNSFSIISPYIVTSIVNVFIKNPKMLNAGDKFKVNIKNICYQLLSTFDDKTRKHICAVVDESTRDVYDNLFRELKRK